MIFVDMKAEVIGKPTPREWKNDNASGVTYKLNLAQNDGCDVSTVKVAREVYESVCKGDEVVVRCSYAEYNDRPDFKGVALVSVKSPNLYAGAPVGAPAGAKSANTK